MKNFKVLCFIDSTIPAYVINIEKPSFEYAAKWGFDTFNECKCIEVESCDTKLKMYFNRDHFNLFWDGFEFGNKIIDVFDDIDLEMIIPQFPITNIKQDKFMDGVEKALQDYRES